MNRENPFCHCVGACVAIASGLLLISAPAGALEFHLGEIRGQLDTTVAVGAAMRAQKRDDDLVGKANLYFEGDAPDWEDNPMFDAEFLPTTDPDDEEWQTWAYGPGSFNINSDDGNLNYDRGDLTFANAMVRQQLQLQWRDHGAFVSGRYFFDTVNTGFDEARGTTRSGEERPRSVEKYAGNRLRLDDAYVYTNATFGERHAALRLGRQVINWGESTFIQHGLNRINPLDAATLRRPGTEIRDVLLPITAVRGIVDLNAAVSVEGVYLLETRNTETDPRGTFFATNDLAGPGGEHLVLGFGRNYDHQPAGGLLPVVPRAADREPGSGGQYGGRLTWFSPALGNTEFSLYGMQMHSRLPLISFIAHEGLDGANALEDLLQVQEPERMARYFVEYPDRVRTWGLSFNTMVPWGWSVGGEISHTRNQPMQIHIPELVYAALSPIEDSELGGTGLIRFPNQIKGDFSAGGEVADSREEISGYRRNPLTQVQTTIINFMGPDNPFRASDWQVVMEIGAAFVHDLESREEFRYHGAGLDLPGGDPATNHEAGDSTVAHPLTTPNDEFPDDFAWGYRLMTELEYNNFLGSSWNFRPMLFFSHDMDGTTPGPAGNFVENTKSATIRLGFDYLSRWEIQVAYSAFWGGRSTIRGAQGGRQGHTNPLRDRDFVSASVSYAF